MYEDKTLVCKECGQEFVFTAGEQEFYAERGFQNEPQRCKACRDARKAASRGPREYFTATCAACGGEAKVPFEPKSDRPVYCSFFCPLMLGKRKLCLEKIRKIGYTTNILEFWRYYTYGSDYKRYDYRRHPGYCA